MYDTIVLKLEGAHFKEYVPSLLDNVKVHSSESSWYVSGSTGTGQKVYVYDGGLKFEGSLCKWYQGDNIKSIGRGDTQRGIEALSDYLQADLSQAEVKRIDVGITFETNYPAQTYFPMFGASGRYTRRKYNSSLYYEVPGRKKIFYDKVRDAKAKGMEIPTHLGIDNLSRFETRYTHGVDNAFNQIVTGETLYDEKFYTSILDKWFTEYDNIRKIGLMQLDKDRIQNPTDLTNQILVKLLLKGTDDIQAGIDELITQAKALEVFDSGNRKNYTRVKAQLNKIIQSESTNDLIIELDKKVKDAIAFYR